jgi:hypothetical protein
MHTTKRKNYIQEKFCYNDVFLVTKHHQYNTRNTYSSKATALRREQCTSIVIVLIIDHRFTQEKIRAHKTIP